MALDNIQITFDVEFRGEMVSPSGKITLGDQENGMQPYHLLFGALGSCFYSTFLVIAKKRRLSFDKVTLEISGSKVPDGDVRLLEKVKIEMVVFNPSNEKGLQKSAEFGAKFCSIHATVSKVAEIELVVTFQ